MSPMLKSDLRKQREGKDLRTKEVESRQSIKISLVHKAYSMKLDYACDFMSIGHLYLDCMTFDNQD